MYGKLLSKEIVFAYDTDHFPIQCKVRWKCLPLKFDFNAEIQNYREYFYHLSFSFSADLKKNQLLSEASWNMVNCFKI